MISGQQMLIFCGATFSFLLSDNLIHDDGVGFGSSCDHDDPVKPLDEHRKNYDHINI